jgi:hypothetical protein
MSIAQIIAVVLFGGFGLVLLYVGATQFVMQRRLLANARRVDAVIIQSEVHTSSSSSRRSTTSHRADVRFRYQVNGVEYESDLLHPNIIVRGYASYEAAREELAPFPLNATVRAYVDPSLPDKAYLVPTAGNGPVVFIVLGLLLPPAAWFIGKYI